MNGQALKLPVIAGAALLLVVWVNDLFVALVRGGEYGSAGYAAHLAAFIAFAAGLGHLWRELGEANRRLAVCRLVWRQWPCALAVVKQGTVVELFGSEALTGLCGLAPGATPGLGDEAVRTEEYPGPDGTTRVVERRWLPLPGVNAGGYAAEIVCEVSDRVRQAGEREGEYLKMLKILVNMFEMKDPYSNGHSEAVSNLAHDLAKTLGLPRGEAETVTRAALLHDIGKIIVPAEVLNKPGALTAAEYGAIKAHAVVGADILATLDIFREEAVIVRHHHERFDGGGYPDRLRGEAIPRGARLIAVADAFDAMTSGRSMRGRREVADALAVIETEKGKQFDPAVAAAFVNMVNAGRTGQDKEPR